MKIWCGNCVKSFLEWEKMASRKIFWHFLHANFFMFILLISNHTVFLVQCGSARAFSAFWKTHSCKLIPNWTRNRVITYTNSAPVVCACFYFYTAFSCHYNAVDREIHYAVLGKKLTRSLSQQLNISESELPFWVITSSKTQTIFFPRCIIKASACKITRAKTKDNGVIRTSPGWKIWIYFQQRIQVSSRLLFHVNFSILLLEVCFRWPTKVTT